MSDEVAALLHAGFDLLHGSFDGSVGELFTSAGMGVSREDAASDDFDGASGESHELRFVYEDGAIAASPTFGLGGIEATQRVSTTPKWLIGPLISGGTLPVIEVGDRFVLGGIERQITEIVNQTSRFVRVEATESGSRRMV